MCINVLWCCHGDVLLHSFLDDAFRKNLESALRFGNPLLVQVSNTQHIMYLYYVVYIVYAY